MELTVFPTSCTEIACHPELLICQTCCDSKLLTGVITKTVLIIVLASVPWLVMFSHLTAADPSDHVY